MALANLLFLASLCAWQTGYAVDLQCTVATLVPSPPSPALLPLCGNGIVDPGEVCDDGNRVGGDGCNAWCTQFDLMNRACTVAGQAGDCPTAGHPVINAPALSSFCGLTAIAVSPDSSFAVLADGGLLIRLPLFVDPSLPMTTFSAAVNYGPFSRFCYLSVMADADTVLAHECASQKVLQFYRGGTAIRTVATISDVLAPSTQMIGAIDTNTDELMIAGTLVTPNDATCSRLIGVGLSNGNVRIAASLPCEAYNIWEGAVTYNVFSLQGMIPYQVEVGPCLVQMPATACYLVRMLRNDMQTVVAYVPRDGGTDYQYTVTTDAAKNVLGAPVTTKSADGALKYTATSACFDTTPLSAPVAGQLPPRVSLGHNCDLSPLTQCWTPLNNPFNTDVVSSPYPLPAGLSVRHTHEQLVTIFTASAVNLSAAMGTAPGSLTSGLPLYRQILQNTYYDTTPIAFAEIPATRDVLYITRTTVGLISAKGVLVNDIHNPGYCIATTMLPCQPGYYGSIGKQCSPCSDGGATDPSIAAQIQCLGAPGGRRLLSSAQSPPSLQLTAIVTQGVTQAHIDTAVSYYLLTKGLPCPAPTDTSFSPKQPYNMDADELQSSIPTQNLTAVLIKAASEATRTQLAVESSADFYGTWSTQQNVWLIQAARLPPAPPQPVTDASLAACAGLYTTSSVTLNVTSGLANALAQGCMRDINKKFGTILLQCLATAAQNWALQHQPASSSRRRLMQAQQGGAVAADQYIATQLHSAPTMVANTQLIFGTQPQSQPPPPPPPPVPSSPPQSSSTPLIIGGTVGGVAGLLLLLLVCYYCHERYTTRHVRGDYIPVSHSKWS